MVVSYSGIAGKRGYNPTKIVIHNDGGSKNATASYYKTWLESHNPEQGFAHDYVASDGTYHAEEYYNSAWHCANAIGNRDYIGIEICQSLGDEKTFLANEQKAFKLAYDLCKKYNIPITVENFPLHKELSRTSCPARSFELHGKSNQKVREYFVAQVKKYGETKTTYLKPFDKPIRVKVLKDIIVYHDKERTNKSTILYKKGSVFILDEYVTIPNRVPVGKPRAGGFVTINTDYVKAL